MGHDHGGTRGTVGGDDGTGKLAHPPTHGSSSSHGSLGRTRALHFSSTKSNSRH